MRVNNLKKEISRNALIQVVNKDAELENPTLFFTDLTNPKSFLVSDGQEAKTDRQGALAFVDSVFIFFRDTFVENQKVTEIKNTVVTRFIDSTSAQTKRDYKDLSFNVFFNNFLAGNYDSDLGLDKANTLRTSYNNLYASIANFSSFTFRLKDSAGNLFLQTAPANSSELEGGHSFSLDLPIDDTTITDKVGYTNNEAIYPFYYSTYYNKEYPISFNLNANQTARNRETWFVNSISIDEQYNKDFNPDFK
jgi:hypothetical protein